MSEGDGDEALVLSLLPPVYYVRSKQFYHEPIVMGRKLYYLLLRRLRAPGATRGVPERQRVSGLGGTNSLMSVNNLFSFLLQLFLLNVLPDAWPSRISVGRLFCDCGTWLVSSSDTPFPRNYSGVSVSLGDGDEALMLFSLPPVFTRTARSFTIGVSPTFSVSTVFDENGLPWLSSYIVAILFQVEFETAAACRKLRYQFFPHTRLFRAY